MSTLSFFAPIEIFNGNPYVYVSAPRAKAIKPGWRKPLPVLIRLNGKSTGQPWRIKQGIRQRLRSRMLRARPASSLLL